MVEMCFDMQEIEKKEKEALAAYHAQFELVITPDGCRAQHKITGQSYQAHDIATGLRHEVK